MLQAQPVSLQVGDEAIILQNLLLLLLPNLIRFVELTPPQKIIEAINFDTADPNFSGEMIMEVTFEPNENGTKVTFLFKNIPAGIRPGDNEAGTISSLEKLAQYVE